MKIMSTLTVASAAVLLVACSDDSNYDFEQSISDAQEAYDFANPMAVFNPATGDIPPTNDFLFSGSADGTLNIPINDTDSAGTQALIASLNTLDGFSTVAPITSKFNIDVDASTVEVGSSVRMFELSKSGTTITGIAAELGNLTEVVATVTGGKTLALLPTVPLKPKTGYLVVVTNGVTTAEGVPFPASSTYQLAQASTPYTAAPYDALEPVRQAVNGYEALAEGAGVVKEDIILSWSFTTQSINDVLVDVYDDATTGSFVAAPSGLTTKNVLDPQGANAAITGNADVYLGTLDVPYFSAIGSGPQDTAPITQSWLGAGDSFLTQFNTTPVSTGDLTIPVLITVPNSSAEPGPGWPVVIFQHGITQDRSNSLAVAEALATAGFMTVSIDLALHGVTDATSPLHADNTAFADTEQTFALDLVNNTTSDAGPDGAVDASGTHFINLSSLLNSRDNIRQSVSNLFVLTNSLGNLAAATAAPVPAVDTNNIRFVGHSLGGIVGSTYLGLETQVSAATLAMPGGGIAQLLNNSVSFGPRITAGLAANGIVEGSEAYDSFQIAAQWVNDSADPINYAVDAAANHAIHMIEVVGGNSGLPDQVVPNSVATAPLSGTEPLARIMGLSDITATTVIGGGVDGIVRFVAGDHSSILDPSSSVEATVEMQNQMATFAATDGSTIAVSDNSVIQQ